MKYVIWGAGKNGRLLYELLGKNRIAAYIDSDPIIDTYKGIPIIDFETYKRDFRECRIIISAVSAEAEIEKTLTENGIQEYDSLSKDLKSIIYFFTKADTNQLIAKLDIDKEIMIAGNGLMVDMMEAYLAEKRYKVKVISENTQVRLGKDESSLSLLSELLSDKTLYYHRELEKFKDIHKNEDCFIIGNGPSLRMEDLETLRKNKAICFGVNGIFAAFQNTKWRPDYYVVSDPDAVIQWYDEITEMEVRGKFISDTAFFIKECDRTDNVYEWNHWLEWETESRPGFSDDFSKISYNGDTVIYDGALQLAVYMGFKEIYLIGTDCCQYAVGPQHFSADYHKKSFERTAIHEDKQIYAYRRAREYADNHGIKIYNATRGGKLEVFERIDFDTLFQQ